MSLIKHPNVRTSWFNYCLFFFFWSGYTVRKMCTQDLCSCRCEPRVQHVKIPRELQITPWSAWAVKVVSDAIQATLCSKRTLKLTSCVAAHNKYCANLVGFCSKVLSCLNCSTLEMFHKLRPTVLYVCVKTRLKVWLKMTQGKGSGEITYSMIWRKRKWLISL